MWIWTGVVGAAGLVVATLLFAKIITTISVSGTGRDWSMAYASRFLGWRGGFSWKVPMSPAQSAKPTTGFDPKKVHKGMKMLRVFSRFTALLWKRTVVDEFSCVIHMGIDDASSTALLVGFVNNILGPWVSLRIAPQCTAAPEYGIYPLWDRAGISADFHATLKFRLFDISSAAVRALGQVAFRKA